MQGAATVKGVPSGDTLLLVGQPRGGPPPEMLLTLSGISAPRLGRERGGGEDAGGEEPFAWRAREFLRSAAVGKVVTFRTTGGMGEGSGNRKFGEVTLEGESLAKMIVRAGYARVKQGGRGGSAGAEGGSGGGSSISPEQEEMLRLEEDARANKLGLWTDDASVMAEQGSRGPVTWSPDEEVLRGICHDRKGTPTRVIVEYVRDGASLRCLLLDNMTVFNLFLTGVQCPRVNTAPRGAAAAAAATATAATTAAATVSGEATAGGSAGSQNATPAAAPLPPTPQPEPFALQARHFTEMRLLHRELDVVIEGMEARPGRNVQIFGTVLHPSGNISVELVRNGLARINDWSVGFTSRENIAAMRAAEQEAKVARRCVWHNWTPPKISGATDFQGTCIEVVSGDTIVVLVRPDGARDGEGEERRVSFASTRAPRMGNARRGQADEPWAWEARELVRDMLIGRTVAVHVDYQRDFAQTNSSGQQGASAKKGEAKPTAAAAPGNGTGASNIRAFATVKVRRGNQTYNVAESLINAGLATAIRHRQGEPRATDYDALLAAEQSAIEEHRGSKSGAEPAVRRVLDISNDTKKAKQHLSFLQRHRTLHGQIEYVFSGSRVKVYVSEENCSITFALAAIRCPQPARGGAGGGQAREAEPFGEEARLFTKERLMQRSVELVVADMDRNGVALGSIFVNAQGGRQDFSHELLRRGLAYLDERAVERRSAAVPSAAVATAFREAQNEGSAASRGVWSLDTPPGQASARGDGEGGGKLGEDGGAGAAPAAEDIITVKLSDIVSGGNLYVHVVGDTSLAGIEQRMEAFNEKYPPTAASAGAMGDVSRLRRGDMVAALFNDGSGDKWYRGVIREVDRGDDGDDDGAEETRFLISFVDYGNRAWVTRNQMHPLDASLKALAPAARECLLAFLHVPHAYDDFGAEAGEELGDMGWGKELTAAVFQRDEENRLLLALYDGDDPTSFNEALVSKGLARISAQATKPWRLRRMPPSAHQLLEKLRDAQQAAHSAHLNMWQHGDPGDSDDEGQRR